MQNLKTLWHEFKPKGYTVKQVGDIFNKNGKDLNKARGVLLGQKESIDSICEQIKTGKVDTGLKEIMETIIKRVHAQAVENPEDCRFFG